MSTYSVWRKSSYSQGENACVELSAAAIRDSKNPEGPRLEVADLAGFLTEVKTDRLRG